MPTYHVVQARSSPSYDLARPLEEQSGWAEHAGFMDGLVQDGFLVLGGPLSDGVHVVHVVEAGSEAEVRTTFARDPWSGSHLTIDSVAGWTIRLDGRVRD